MKKSFVLILLVLTLLLISCGSGTENYTEIGKLDSGNFSFTLIGTSQGVIKRIYVYKDGNSVCILGAANGRDTEFVDVNFDGNPDLLLRSEEDRNCYQCFVYLPNIDSFGYYEQFERLPSPVIDAANKEIRCDTREKEYVSDPNVDHDVAYKETQASSVWKWEAGTLTKIRERGIEYFSESNIYCTYEAKLVNGELIRDGGDEHWFYSLDSLTAAGYDWKE